LRRASQSESFKLYDGLGLTEMAASARTSRSRYTVSRLPSRTSYAMPQTPSLALARSQEVAMCMSISWRSAMAGASCLCGSGEPVIGEILEESSQRSMARRSKAWPSAVVTGSRITSPVIGQMNCDGVSFGGAGGRRSWRPVAPCVRRRTSVAAASASTAAAARLKMAADCCNAAQSHCGASVSLGPYTTGISFCV